MKTFLKIVVGILLLLALVLVVLSVTGFEPKDRRPGLWLKGELVTTPVTDWSFTDQIPEIKVQTHTWYLLPHSITTGCTGYNGQLYLTSVYPPNVPYPKGRSWNQDVVRDPHVRLKIAGKLYDVTLALVTDPAEKETILAAKWKKYPQQKRPGPDTLIVLYHVLPS